MAKGREWNAVVAAELGHEVKNVLMVIRTLGSMLLEELPPAGDGIQLVDDLLQTTERATRLSHRLMQLARDTLCDGPADLVAAVSRQATTLKHIAKDGHRVEVETCETPIWTPLSTVDAQQVVFNLAHNAFDAMSDGGTLLIQVRAANGTAALVVRDTGTGMDAATLRDCLDPFFTTKGEEGTGLGLHAVRDAVERAGGRVTIESMVGEGTAVAIYLPMLDPAPTS